LQTLEKKNSGRCMPQIIDDRRYVPKKLKTPVVTFIMYYIISSSCREGIPMRTHTLYFMITAFILSLLLTNSVSYADSWQKASLPPSITQDLYAVWGSWDGDIYAAGASGTLIYWDGSTWQEITTNTSDDLTSLWELPNIAVFSAGDLGTILLNGGTGWLMFKLTDSRLNALWGLSATNVYAVGSLGTILFFNGTSWKDVAPSITTGIDLYSIWGNTGNDIYVGGQNGTMFHYDGTTWKAVSSIPTSQDIRALWGSSGSDIYAADTNGDILHYNGSSWTIATTTTGIALNTLWGSSPVDVFAAGENGIVYHYDGNSWGSLPSVPTSLKINAVWGSTSGKVYFAGQDGTFLIYTRPDHIPPVINFSEISKNNDGTAYISTPVTFLFSEKMDPASINASTIILESGSTVVSRHVSLSSDGMTVSVSGNDAFSTPCTLTITGGSNGVKDLAGNVLASSYSVSFTTEAKPVSTHHNIGGGGGCFISSARM
jgi:hypothetical protein